MLLGNKNQSKRQGKWKVLGAVILVIIMIMLASCQTTSSQSSSGSSSQITAETSQVVYNLQISLNNGETILFHEDVTLEKDQSLLDSIKSVADVKEQGGFISSIEGHEQNTNENKDKWWLFEINGNFGEKGANETFPQNGDKIVFDLHGME